MFELLKIGKLVKRGKRGKNTNYIYVTCFLLLAGFGLTYSSVKQSASFFCWQCFVNKFLILDVNAKTLSFLEALVNIPNMKSFSSADITTESVGHCKGSYTKFNSSFLATSNSSMGS